MKHPLWLAELNNRHSDVMNTTSHRVYQTGEGERGSEVAANDLGRLRIRLPSWAMFKERLKNTIRESHYKIRAIVRINNIQIYRSLLLTWLVVTTSSFWVACSSTWPEGWVFSQASETVAPGSLESLDSIVSVPKSSVWSVTDSLGTCLKYFALQTRVVPVSTLTRLNVSRALVSMITCYAEDNFESNLFCFMLAQCKISPTLKLCGVAFCLTSWYSFKRAWYKLHFDRWTWSRADAAVFELDSMCGNSIVGDFLLTGCGLAL